MKTDKKPFPPQDPLKREMAGGNLIGAARVKRCNEEF